MSHFSTLIIVKKEQAEAVEELIENNGGAVLEDYIQKLAVSAMQPYGCRTKMVIEDTYEEIVEHGNTLREGLLDRYMQIPHTEEAVRKMLYDVGADTSCERNPKAFIRLMKAGLDADIHQAVCDIYDYQTDKCGNHIEEEVSGGYLDCFDLGRGFTDTLNLKPEAMHTSEREGFMQELLEYNQQETETGGSIYAVQVKDADFGIRQEKYKESCEFWDRHIEPEAGSEFAEKPFYNADYYKQNYKNREFFAKIQSIPSTHAVVDENGWREVGDMGMFGTSSETESQFIEWRESFYDTFIRNLHPDDLLILANCHI